MKPSEELAWFLLFIAVVCVFGGAFGLAFTRLFIGPQWTVVDTVCSWGALLGGVFALVAAALIIAADRR